MGLGLEIVLFGWSLCAVWIFYCIFLRPRRDWEKDPWNAKDTVEAAATAAFIAYNVEKRRRKQNAKAIAQAIQDAQRKEKRWWID